MFKRKYFEFVTRLFIRAIDSFCPIHLYSVMLLSTFQVQLFFLSRESWKSSLRDGAMCYLSIKKDKIKNLPILIFKFGVVNNMTLNLKRICLFYLVKGSIYE